MVSTEWRGIRTCPSIFAFAGAVPCCATKTVAVVEARATAVHMNGKNKEWCRLQAVLNQVS